MAATIQQIADIVGVSRGTVDRAIHGRGRIDPAVEERILRTARELGYKAVPPKREPAPAVSPFRLGAILQSAETPTMQDVARGMRQAAADLRIAGAELLLREVDGLDTGAVLAHMDELLAAGIRGLALAPNTDPALARRIDDLAARGIPVVTLNSDVPRSRRLCFVGMNNRRAAQMAAWLTCQMLHAGGEVFALAGHPNNTAHADRLSGFLEGLETDGHGAVRMLGFQPCFDRDELAYELTAAVLRQHPALTVVYVVAHGQAGVCRAIEEAGRTGQVKVIAYDLNDPNRQLLRQEKVDFVLDQRAFEQGSRPLHILSDYILFDRVPDTDVLYTDISIRTKYNIV